MIEHPGGADLLGQVETLQNILVACATGRTGGSDTGDYEQLREALLTGPLADKLPRFVVTHRTLGQFWPFIKGKFGTYDERRAFLWDAFRPVIDELEFPNKNVHAADVDGVLNRLTADDVRRLWAKAQARLNDDPDGAITASRSLLESVCKLVAVDLRLHADVDKLDLPQLYGLVAKSLSLSPAEHSEPVFKEILSGCISVVNGFAALRNKLSDAHGIGPRRVNPSRRHAALAVGLAGTMSMFLLETWETRKAPTA